MQKRVYRSLRTIRDQTFMELFCIWYEKNSTLISNCVENFRQIGCKIQPAIFENNINVQLGLREDNLELSFMS